ncbi:uncharacterized protein ATNIH1004_005418 [Aspergillus tanneri]|uniref:Uncharacterized protein n=1 Tax=Aspergillus tanneri TaxID=1220188 RepID=A0A5M9MP65_9EURO|nr:uncharacterized protein ATNIH1004_005418 [Aspergillus tanneri]KAA8646743.1 hypothetical protein ATNIH1004_005418 [Aspergillus tanneri]
MTVTLFQLWAVMEIYTVHQFPLLKEYPPPFPPEVLDILQLSKYEDLARLQRYNNICKSVNHSVDSKLLRYSPILHDIETASSTAKDRKKVELNGINELYSSLSQRITSTICTRKRDPPGTGCRHCRLKKLRKKLQITAHKDFLPEESTKHAAVQRRAILFELAMPSCLAAYRDTSWRILAKFGRPKDEMEASLPPPRVLLSRWDSLRPYVNHRELRFHLASTTKSFLVSHYKGSALPVTNAQILLPFGLRLLYYDTREERWASHLSSGFTFAHSFGLHQSILTLLGPENASEFAADADGRSSYKIMSFQNQSPGSARSTRSLKMSRFVIGWQLKSKVYYKGSRITGANLFAWRR